MPRMIFVGKTGNSVSRDLSHLESFQVEALTATIDTTGMVAGTQTACDVVFRDDAGLLIARSRSSATLPDGGTVTMTFAPWLPDTLELGNLLAGYVNTTGLCATVLPAGGSVTVQPVDPLAIVKGFNMWVEDATDAQRELDDSLAAIGDWQLVPGPGAGV